MPRCIRPHSLMACMHGAFRSHQHADRSSSCLRGYFPCRGARSSHIELPMIPRMRLPVHAALVRRLWPLCGEGEGMANVYMCTVSHYWLALGALNILCASCAAGLSSGTKTTESQLKTSVCPLSGAFLLTCLSGTLFLS